MSDFTPLSSPKEFAQSVLLEQIKQATTTMADLRQKFKTMPAVNFTADPRWTQARWHATTFQWHPESEAPPMMGLGFEKPEIGRDIFRDFTRGQRNHDAFEELRIAIVEGQVPGQPFGYSVHLGPDPESLAAYATVEGVVLKPTMTRFLGRWNRFYPTSGEPILLRRFQEELEKHQEFLLAPVIKRADGKEYMDVESGIMKTVVHFRTLSEITIEDIDSMALVLPTLIPPRK